MGVTPRNESGDDFSEIQMDLDAIGGLVLSRNRSRRDIFDFDLPSSPMAWLTNAAGTDEPHTEPPPADTVNPECLETQLTCSCKKSRCLKLYCPCFAANVHCNGCGCTGCENDASNAEFIQKEQRRKVKRRKFAFQPKVISVTQAGCACKKSGCTKKYCECFQNAISCGDHCRCQGCQNRTPTFGPIEAPLGGDKSYLELAALCLSPELLDHQISSDDAREAWLDNCEREELMQVNHLEQRAEDGMSARQNWRTLGTTIPRLVLNRLDQICQLAELRAVVAEVETGIHRQDGDRISPREALDSMREAFHASKRELGQRQSVNHYAGYHHMYSSATMDCGVQMNQPVLQLQTY